MTWAGVGRSGSPMPRSTRSEPRARASFFWRSISAKRYGGSFFRRSACSTRMLTLGSSPAILQLSQSTKENANLRLPPPPSGWGNILDSQHVVHRVQTRLGPGHEADGAERALGKGVATVGPVRQLQPLAERGEHHGVVAGDVAAAERVDPDLLRAALPHQPVPAVDAHLPEVPPQ